MRYIWRDNLRRQHLSLSLVKPTLLMDRLRSQPITGGRIHFDNQIEFRRGWKSRVTMIQIPPRSCAEPPDTVGRFLQRGDDLLIHEERGRTTFRERSSVGGIGPPFFETEEELPDSLDGRERAKLEYVPDTDEVAVPAETEPSDLCLTEQLEVEKEKRQNIRLCSYRA